MNVSLLTCSKSRPLPLHLLRSGWEAWVELRVEHDEG